MNLPTDKFMSACNIYYESVSSEDTKLLNELSLEDPDGLLSSSVNFKHQVVFNAGFLSLKHAKKTLLGKKYFLLSIKIHCTGEV